MVGFKLLAGLHGLKSGKNELVGVLAGFLLQLRLSFYSPLALLLLLLILSGV